MSDTLLKIIVKAQDLASSTFKKIGESLDTLQGSTTRLSSHGFLVMQKGFESLKRAITLGVPLIVGSFSVLGTIGLKAADEFEKGLLKYQTLLGSQQAALQRMEELQQFAAKTPFELKDIIKADVLLQGFGLRTQKLLNIIGDAAAISGSGFAELSLIMGQLSQSKDLENIKQLAERGVITFEELQAAGISFAKSGAVVNSVEETFSTVVSIMEKKFGGGMKKLSGTMSGLLTTIKDNVNIGLGIIATESGLLDFIKDKMEQLIVWIDSVDWSAIGRKLGQTLLLLIPIFSAVETAAKRVFSNLQNSWAWFWNTGWPTLQPILLALYNLFLTYLYPSLTQLVSSFLELWNVLGPYLMPLLQYLAVILGAVLVASIVVLCGVLKVLADSLSFVFDLLREKIIAGQQYVEAFWRQWEEIKNRLKSIFLSIGQSFYYTVLDYIKKTLKVVNDLINMLNSVSGSAGGPKIPNISIPGFANGVRDFSGGIAMVGEKGPELVYLPRGANVYSNTETRQLMNQKPTVSVTLNFSGSFLGTARDRRELVHSLKTELQQILA